MPAIKDIQKTYGSDTRFQLIGISCDRTAQAAEQYIKQNGLIWTHGFAGNLLAGVNASKGYKVRGIPATFLIGADGRILAKNLRGAELKEAVGKALGDDKVLSPTNRVTSPARFPVTRFDLPGDRAAERLRSSSSTTPTRISKKTALIMISSGCYSRPIVGFARPFLRNSTRAR